MEYEEWEKAVPEEITSDSLRERGISYPTNVDNTHAGSTIDEEELDALLQDVPLPNP